MTERGVFAEDGENKNEGENKTNNLESNGRFLHDLTTHEIAKTFTGFTKDKRILIMPIGFAQAGKSLFLSSLMYYARKGQETLFRSNIKTDFPYNNGHVAVDEMISSFDKGRLYKTNRKGTLDLIGIDITPSNPKRPKLNLAFLDLAGDDIQSIKTDEKKRFTENINAVFEGMKIDNSPIIFTLITPFEPVIRDGESLDDAHRREDALHYDFLNYIKEKQSAILKSAKFFIIISQWDINQDENLQAEHYIREYRPSIYTYVKNLDVVWGSYSVGKILETRGELAKNLGKSIIKKIDSKNITITDFNQKWTLHN